MDSAHVLLSLLGAGASFTTFCLLRFPRTRRPQFQLYGPFSLTVSFLGAMGTLFLSALMVCAHAVWR